jgi:hypothetical protein
MLNIYLQDQYQRQHINFITKLESINRKTTKDLLKLTHCIKNFHYFKT